MENCGLTLTTVKTHVKFNNSLVKCDVSLRAVNEVASGRSSPGFMSPSSPSLEEAPAAGASRLSCDFSTKRGWEWKEGRRERAKKRPEEENTHIPLLTDTSETLGQSSPQLFHFAHFLRGLRGWHEVAHIRFFVRLHCDFAGAALAAGGGAASRERG